MNSSKVIDLVVNNNLCIRSIYSYTNQKLLEKLGG